MRRPAVIVELPYLLVPACGCGSKAVAEKGVSEVSTKGEVPCCLYVLRTRAPLLGCWDMFTGFVGPSLGNIQLVSSCIFSAYISGGWGMRAGARGDLAAPVPSPLNPSFGLAQL